MKKPLSLIAVFAIYMSASAQLTVSSVGDVTMPGHVAISEALPTDSVGLNIACTALLGGEEYGVHSYILYPYLPSFQTGRHVGILGKVTSTGYFPPNPKDFVMPTPFAAGIVGISGDGCGVYGSTSANLPTTWTLGSIAGYFSGDVKVTGTLTATTINNSSDLRLKDNISNIKEPATSLLNSLNPISFTFKSDSMLYLKEGEEKRMHYGFIAQEVKELFPNLVTEDGAGYLSVNYIELIPLLVHVVKQQQMQINELKDALSVSMQSKAKKNLSDSFTSARLFQNTPNPFSQSTQIGYYLPIDTREAAIHVYDMSGMEIMAFAIDTFGQGELTIDGGTLRAGMYLYSLIEDGQLIDTKQMILTK